MKLNFFDKDQPLWLPKNSVRSLIALAFTGATIYALITGIDVKDTLFPICMAIVGFYYGKRGGE